MDNERANKKIARHPDARRGKECVRGRISEAPPDHVRVMGWLGLEHVSKNHVITYWQWKWESSLNCSFSNGFVESQPSHPVRRAKSTRMPIGPLSTSMNAPRPS